MANPLHRVLIVDPSRSLPEPRSRAERGRSIVTETVSSVTEAVRRLQDAGYDAVLVKVSLPEEVALVVRIKTQVPGARVLAVTREGVRWAAEGTPQDDPVLRRCREAIDRGQDLMDRLRDAQAERQRILEESLQAVGAPVEKLIPVLIESDDRHARHLRRAFEDLGFPFPHPVLKTSKEGMAFLGGSSTPMPTLILVGLPSPKTATFALISWIRSRDLLANLPVFVLGTSLSPETRRQVNESGADAYFSKPTFPGEHEELVRSVALRWGTLFGKRFASASRRS